MNTNRPPRTLTSQKIRDAHLASLLAAALDYEAAPNMVHLERMVLGAARAWAKAERALDKGAHERRAAP